MNEGRLGQNLVAVVAGRHQAQKVYIGVSLTGMIEKPRGPVLTDVGRTIEKGD